MRDFGRLFTRQSPLTLCRQNLITLSLSSPYQVITGKEMQAMPCRPFLPLPFLALLAMGCVTDPSRPVVSWYERTNVLQGPTGSDVVQIDVALLEQPIGDRYLNDELWTLADEQFLPLDRKKVFAENGLRIGQISGITPPGLQAMLTSDRSNPTPRQKQMRATKSTSIELGPVLEQCRFEINKDKNSPSTLVEMKQALCSLEVTPALGEEGRTRLHFVPRLAHGASNGLRGITPESINWLTKQQQRPAESFEQLGWDVSLLPNEYVVIGGRYDRPNTLGHTSFVRPDEVNPVQRLLVIRVTRLQPEPAFANSDQADSLHQSPPLALQAAWTTSRSSESSP